MPARWRVRPARFSWASECSWRSPAGSRCGSRRTSGWKSWSSTNSPARRANPPCLKRGNRKFFPHAVRASNLRDFSCRDSPCYCSCWRSAACGCSGAGFPRPPPASRPTARWRRFRFMRFSRCCCSWSVAFRSPLRGSKAGGCCVRARVFYWRARMSAPSRRSASPEPEPNCRGPISGSRAACACCSV